MTIKDPRKELLNSELNNVVSDNARKYFDWYIEWATERVAHLYSEEIREGEITGLALDALIHLEALAGTEQERQSLTQTQLMLIYESYTQALFHHAGFASIDEWLDSRGINIADRKLKDLKTLATVVIPWCDAYGVVIDGEKVGVYWFARQVEGKNLANRARYALDLMLEVINQNWPVANRRDELQTILGWVADPRITNTVLKEQLESGGLRGAPPPKITMYVNGSSVQLEFDLQDKKQLRWLKARLTGADITIIDRQAIYIDQGLAWLNPDCFTPIKKPGPP
jgi:hypothetical protein